MNIPFTPQQFMDVFLNYNLSVWPMQIVLNLLALVAVWFCWKQTKFSSRIVAFILTLLWFWTGIVYHLHFFSEINPAAYLFGTLFVAQGLIFMYAGVVRGGYPGQMGNKGHRENQGSGDLNLSGALVFGLQMDLAGSLGLIMVLYALIIYPLLGHALGHVYPRSPTFGLPCPTTIFTFGLLLWTGYRGTGRKALPLPVWVYIIPFIWALIGLSAVFRLGIYEDLGLIISGMIAVAVLIRRARRQDA